MLAQLYAKSTCEAFARSFVGDPLLKCRGFDTTSASACAEPPRGHSDDAPRADFGHIEFICEKFLTSLLDRMRAATRYDAKILWKYEPKQDPNVILRDVIEAWGPPVRFTRLAHWHCVGDRGDGDIAFGVLAGMFWK